MKIRENYFPELIPLSSPRTRSLAVPGMDPYAQVAGSGALALDGALDTLTDVGFTGAGTGSIGATTTVATAGTTSTMTTNRLNPSTATGAVPAVQGSSPIGKLQSPPKLTCVPQRPPSTKPPADAQPYVDPSAPPPDYNSIVEKAGLPAAAGTSGILDVASSSSKDLKLKRRNMGLGMRPRIIIFSDKKDLIRVSLDTEDESDNEICNLSFKKHTSKYLGIKSARRRSIAGESFTLSSSMESLSDDAKFTEEKGGSTSKENLIVRGYDDIPGIDGAINYAFDPEEFDETAAEAELVDLASKAAASNTDTEDKKNSGKGKPKLAKKDSPKSESQTDEEQTSDKTRATRPKSAKPKSAGKSQEGQTGKGSVATSSSSSVTAPSPKKVKIATRDSIPEQADEEAAEEADKRPSSKDAFEKSEKPATSSKDKSSRAGRSKSAKNGHNKVEPRSKDGGSSSSKAKSKTSKKKGKAVENEDDDDGESSSSPSRTRPLTALDRWNDKDVENMSKIVAWDRPEDDI